MIDINDAEVLVETQFSIDSYQNNGTWFRLSDYSTIGEFFIDCACWFDDEESPEYVYPEWRDIPDGMITRNWISPNLFELREAMQDVDESRRGGFWNWCSTFGWDVGKDDPHKIVTEYCYSMSSCPIDEPPEPPEDEECLYVFDHTGHSYEIFDDNYN